MTAMHVPVFLLGSSHGMGPILSLPCVSLVVKAHPCVLDRKIKRQLLLSVTSETTRWKHIPGGKAGCLSQAHRFLEVQRNTCTDTVAEHVCFSSTLVQLTLHESNCTCVVWRYHTPLSVVLHAPSLQVPAILRPRLATGTCTLKRFHVKWDKWRLPLMCAPCSCHV